MCCSEHKWGRKNIRNMDHIIGQSSSMSIWTNKAKARLIGEETG